MKIKLDELKFVEFKLNNLNEILQLQDEVILSLENPLLLRKNTPEMFVDCLTPPNYTIGVKSGDKLIALGVLYLPKDNEEDLSHLLIGVDLTGKKSANYKLCMVAKDYRGNGLQVALGKMLEDKAKEYGINLLCATVSPDNFYSRNNMLKLGYTFNTTLPKYNGVRDIFYKFI